MMRIYNADFIENHLRIWFRSTSLNFNTSNYLSYVCSPFCPSALMYVCTFGNFRAPLVSAPFSPSAHGFRSLVQRSCVPKPTVARLSIHFDMNIYSIELNCQFNY